MDNQTRRDVDEACLRLMGWTDLEWALPKQEWQPGYWKGRRGVMRRETGSPSKDANFVVPLAEALRARGYSLDIWGGSSGWRVVIGPENLIEAEADTLPEALTIAAARAVGTETKE